MNKKNNNENKSIGYYIRRFFLFILLVLCIRNVFWNEFYSHSLYYAEHTPHDDDSYPEFYLFTQRFGNIPAKGKRYYEKDFADGSLDSTDGKYTVTIGYDDIFFFNYKRSISCALNYKGYIKVYEMGVNTEYKDGKDMTESERKVFEQMMEEYLAPAKKATTKPLINLQWLFDKIYEGRFVDE